MRARLAACRLSLAVIGRRLAARLQHRGACRAAPALLRAALASAMPVDVELVLAVDISYSMDPDEQALQREGYIQALTSREFLQRACARACHGKIAVTYFEWAGAARPARSSCRGG